MKHEPEGECDPRMESVASKKPNKGANGCCTSRLTWQRRVRTANAYPQEGLSWRYGRDRGSQLDNSAFLVPACQLSPINELIHEKQGESMCS